MTEDNDLSGIDLDDLDFGEDSDLGGGGDDIDLGDLDAAGDVGGGGDDIDLGDMDAGGGDDKDGDFDSDLADVLAGDSDAGGGDFDMDGGDMDAGGDAGSDEEAPPLPTVHLSATEATNLEFLLDINLHVTFEVGRSKMLVSDLLTLGQGSVVELHRLVGDELDLLINGRLVAKGEVIVVNEKFGCKITEIISPDERIRHLANL